MSNPYQPPSFDPKQFQDAPYMPAPAANSGFGWVSQVRIVAILNCVQGGLEIPLGLMLLGAAAFVPYLIQMEKANNPGAAGGGPPPEFEWILPAAYGSIGTLLLAAGILRIYAGIQNFRFRGRVLGIVSFCLGLVSMMGCYCTPTSIALLVYGLIVYLNPAVIAAFEMGKQGMTGDAILASFSGYRPMQPPPPNYPQ